MNGRKKTAAKERVEKKGHKGGGAKECAQMRGRKIRYRKQKREAVCRKAFQRLKRIDFEVSRWAILQNASSHSPIDTYYLFPSRSLSRSFDFLG